MPTPLKATLPPDCVLSAGYVIRITALDALTGAVISNVQLSDISIFVTDLIGETETADTAPRPLLVPTTDDA